MYIWRRVRAKSSPPVLLGNDEVNTQQVSLDTEFIYGLYLYFHIVLVQQIAKPFFLTEVTTITM